MTDMLVRAARAMRPYWTGATGKGGGYGDCWEGRSEDIARSSLLAALDPFDADLNAILVERTNHPARDIQRIIAALREECLAKGQSET
jgi:hypothetical protein